jgi:GLPGLI family protein
LLIVLSNYGYSQNLEVEYKVRFLKVEEIVKKELTQEQLKAARKIYRKAQFSADNKNLILKTSVDGNFLLETSSGMSLDSGFNRNGNKNHIPFIGVRQYVYGDKNETYSFSSNDPFIVKHDLNQIVNWNITTETKNYLGYKCFKATPVFIDDNHVVVNSTPKYIWFSPELAVTGGPILYPNVPGLILEVVLGNSTITASNIQEISTTPIFPDAKKPIYTHQQAKSYYNKVSKILEKRINNN